jgi:predicted protein tyrosine phosphatase
MALALKNKGQDAIAISLLWNSKETFELLSNWADYIVLMEQRFRFMVPAPLLTAAALDKTRVVDVGPDTYSDAQDDDLQLQVKRVAAEWQLKNWKI